MRISDWSSDVCSSDLKTVQFTQIDGMSSTQSPLVSKALAYAAAAHGSIDHVRKYTGEPYIHHPIEVMEIVSSVPHTEDMLAAALLHDTIERSEEHTSELQSLMRISYAVFCLKK